MGKKLIIHGADFSGITYGNYQFSAARDTVSIAPGESVTVLVTSSRVPTQNGVVGSAQFCPFTVAIQGDASCELGQISGLTQTIIISAPNNADGSSVITLTQTDSGNTKTVTVSVVTYHLSVSDPAEYDNGRIAMGRTKTVIVTSYKEEGGAQTFVDFSVTAPSGATAVKDTPSGTTCEVTIGIPYDVAFLGKANTWEFEQSNGTGLGSIAMNGVPNWVMGYWSNGSFQKVLDYGAKWYVSLKDPASSAPAQIPINNSIDFSITVSDRNSRFQCVAAKEVDANIAPPRTVASLNALLTDLNSAGNTWSLNFGTGNPNPLLFDWEATADANGFYYPTAEQLEEINDNVIFTQKQQK